MTQKEIKRTLKESPESLSETWAMVKRNGQSREQPSQKCGSSNGLKSETSPGMWVAELTQPHTRRVLLRELLSRASETLLCLLVAEATPIKSPEHDCPSTS